MDINIQLTDQSPPFWFLGDPKQMKVCLNFSNPGPISIQFDQLSESERKKILISVQKQHIAVNISYDELVKKHSSLQVPLETSVAPEVKEFLEKKQQQKYENKQLKIFAEQAKKEKQRQSRCEFLVKQKTSAIKKQLKDENDIKVLRMIRDLEQAKHQPRSGIVAFINEKIQKIQIDLNTNIEKTLDEKPLNIKEPETLGYDVVNLQEEQTVQFSEEEIRRFANGEPLGGE